MHSMLIDPFASLLAQSMIGSIWGTLWPYLAMLGGFSAIVFVHELGHFAVAKWADVRVERFAIGFGRELIGFTRGETRYSFNILPLGGYVKMLGQEDFDDKAKELMFNDDPRSFVNKPVGHRMAIVSAGVIMNIIFACFLFMVVFMIGMEAVAPRIALVEPDSPADKAGLLPGDIIREINGESILEFRDIEIAIFLAQPHVPVEFVVERNGETHAPIWMEPEYRMPTSSRDTRRQKVGISPGFNPEIVAVGPQIDTTRPDQPHVGDWLDEVDGIKVTKDNASEINAMLAYHTGDIFVLRKNSDDPDAPSERVRVEIPPLFTLFPSDLRDTDTMSLLGLRPLVRVLGINSESRAYYAGIESGDTILSFNDQDYPSQKDIIQSVRENAERDIAFKIQKMDGRIVQDFVRPKTNRKGAGTIQARVVSMVSDDAENDTPKTQFSHVNPGGVAQAAGIESGDIVLDIHQNQFPSVWTFEKVIRNNRDNPLKLHLLKADGSEVVVDVIPQASGLIGAGLELLAEDIMITGKILKEIHGRPSPAYQANIPDGVRILSVNDQPISRWGELIQIFRQQAGTTVNLAYLDHDGQTQKVSFEVPHSIRTLLGIGPEARIVSIDGSDSVQAILGTATEKLSIQHREGIRQKLMKLDGKKNITVEYRDNPLADLKTAQIDVTQDMIDPWLSRVHFSPNVRLDYDRILLKGEGALDAVSIGIHKTYYFILQVYKIMERLIFTRSVGVENISGPLGIIDIGGQVAQQGLVQFLFFLAMISANLAVINFLPFPIVDGGLMVFLIIEKIKGSPVSLRVQVATQMIGLFFIISFFVFITYQDVLRMTG